MTYAASSAAPRVGWAKAAVASCEGGRAHQRWFFVDKPRRARAFALRASTALAHPTATSSFPLRAVAHDPPPLQTLRRPHGIKFVELRHRPRFRRQHDPRRLRRRED